MFCQMDSKGLSQVQTMETSAKILRKAVFDNEMSCKLAGVNDLIAAEGKYHLKCYTKFQRNTDKNAADFKEVNSDPRVTCFEEIMSSLEKGLCRGRIYSLKAVWTSFPHRLESHYHLDPGVYRGNKLKEKIQLFLQDKITFVQPLNPSEPFLIVSSNLNEAAMRSLLKESNVEGNVDNAEYEEELNNDDVEAVDLDAELLSWLYRVAVKVHHDVKSAPGIDCIGSIDEQSAESVVPESLFMLISLLCAGDQEDDVNMKTRILSICQDIVFLVSRGRKLTPKHIGLGLTVHQATRSKELVQLLYSAGHSVSYEAVMRMGNTIANDVLERYNENGKVFVPRNFTAASGESYTRYAVDNIDINEETLSGMGTFHATQFAALRRMEESEPKIKVQITPRAERQLNLDVPSELHELKKVELESDKHEPVIQGRCGL